LVQTCSLQIVCQFGSDLLFTNCVSVWFRPALYKFSQQTLAVTVVGFVKTVFVC